tara:strand:- start:2424 stop:2813 length:390 start_codon:yes stop_codon:yes gene_type:complete
MGNRFASGKIAVAICDRCGFRFRLRELKELVIKTKKVNLLACPACWDPDQPQLQLGMYPVDDPQGLRNPRPDSTYLQSGVLADGSIGGGSRDIQWGWSPVGGGNNVVSGGTPNDLVANGFIGTVTVTTS